MTQITSGKFWPNAGGREIGWLIARQGHNRVNIAGMGLERGVTSALARTRVGPCSVPVNISNEWREPISGRIQH
ncbi:hypothetical protein GCM10020366_54050 [Saccharopolyspora gregorii]|uniref:Uncharacterized protein n=1 Tax=Saccharopolyspora gregorii TaxID=33914 RepID=A0ABP6RY41_9PSEU